MNTTRPIAVALGAFAIACALGAHPLERASANVVLRPPPTGPTLAYCQSVPAGQTPPAGCAQKFAQAINQHLSSTPADARPMYHADPSGYPVNLATTIPQNLNPAGWQTAVDATGAAWSSSDLAYAPIITSHWVKAKGSLTNRVDPATFKPHTAFASDPNGASSCEDWVYKMWNPISGYEDRAAACFGDMDCAFDQLVADDPVTHSASPYLRGIVTGIRPTFERPWSIYVLPEVTSTTRPKNAFFAINPFFLNDLTDAIWQEVAKGTAACPSSGPPPLLDCPVWFIPRSYAGGGDVNAKLKAIQSLIVNGSTYTIGTPTNTWRGATDVAFETEGKFALAMRNGMRSVPMATRIAARARMQHIVDLIAHYDHVTTMSCSTSSSGGGGGGGAGGGAGNIHLADPIRLPPQCPKNATGYPNGPPAGAPDVVVAAAQIQDEIVTALLQEFDRGSDGCFGANTTLCDWDPVEFVPRMLTAMHAEREQDFTTCTEWKAPAWSWWATSLDAINAMLAGAKAAAVHELAQAPGLPAPGVGAAMAGTQPRFASIGQIIPGSRSFGDPDWAGASYSYLAYWKVTPKFASADPTAHPCELDGELHAEMHVVVDLLKTVAAPFCKAVDDAIAGMRDLSFDSAAFKALMDPLVSGLENVPYVGGAATIPQLCVARYRLKHLADASLTVTAAPQGNHYAADFFFAGEQLWNPSGALLEPYTGSWPSAPEKLDGFQDTIWVGPVPVTFQLYGEVQYGADLDLSVGSTSTCGNASSTARPTLGARAAFTPWAHADALGSVAIGFSFAEAGVRGRLRVVDTRLPLNAGVAITDPNGTGLLAFDVNAAIQGTFNSGDISAFAELFGAEVEKVIWSWSGDHVNVPIFSPRFPAVPMPVFDQRTWQDWQNGRLPGQTRAQP